MATLWEIITGNSTLPDDGVNTFWDHLNNQAGGSGTGATVYLQAFKVTTEADNDTLVLPDAQVECVLKQDAEKMYIIVDDDELNLED